VPWKGCEYEKEPYHAPHDYSKDKGALSAKAVSSPSHYRLDHQYRGSAKNIKHTHFHQIHTEVYSKKGKDESHHSKPETRHKTLGDNGCHSRIGAYTIYAVYSLPEKFHSFTYQN
jgi:hypothetical protein